MELVNFRNLDRSLGQSATDWDSLNFRLFEKHPMLDSRFIDPLLKYFGDGSETLLVIESGGIISGMSILRSRGLGLWTTFLPSQAQVGPVLIREFESACDGVLKLPGYPIQIDFLCLDLDWQLSNICWKKNINIVDHALTINISLNGDFSSYWEGRSKNLVHNIARYSRRLERDGVERKFICLTNPDDVAKAVQRYALLESSGWKGKAGTALELGDEQTEFYAEIMSQFSKAGEAMVFELWIDNQLAASRLVISNDRMLIILKTTYNEKFKQYAPSRLLLFELIQFAFLNKPGGTIEFYTDANSDQVSWATGYRWIKHITFFRNELVGQFVEVGNNIRRSFTGSGVVEKESEFRVDVYSNPDQFTPEVIGFIQDVNCENVEGSVVWYKNIIRTVFSEDREGGFCVLIKSGAPVAFLPIRIIRDSKGLVVESLTNFYSSIYCPAFSIFLKPRDLISIFDSIRLEYGEVSEFRFAPMDPDSRLYGLLINGLRISGFAPFSFFCFGNWYQKIQGDWLSYWGQREGILRNTAKRAEVKFKKDGGVLELISDGSGIDDAINAFQEVYSSSWKRPEPHPLFVPGLIRACADNGWLRLGIARMNGKPVAAEIWIVAHGKAEIYKLAYHEDYKSYSPGKLLTAFLMKHVIEVDQVKEVDYLIGDDPHKQFWMSHRRERWGIVAYNPRTLMGALGLIREVLGRFVKSVFSGVSRKRSVQHADGTSA